MLQYVPISVVHISRKSLKMSRWNREIIIIPIIITNRWQIILTSWTQPLSTPGLNRFPQCYGQAYHLYRTQALLKGLKTGGGRGQGKDHGISELFYLKLEFVWYLLNLLWLKRFADEMFCFSDGKRSGGMVFMNLIFPTFLEFRNSSPRVDLWSRAIPTWDERFSPSKYGERGNRKRPTLVHNTIFFTYVLYF